jgi:hypothetical protein
MTAPPITVVVPDEPPVLTPRRMRLLLPVLRDALNPEFRS